MTIDYSDLIGIPFAEHGDGVTGINCYDLMCKAHEKHNIYLPKTNISVCACKEISNQEIIKHIDKYWEEILKPTHPCWVLIKSSNPHFADHVATYIGRNRILHITMKTNSMIERFYPTYSNQIVGIYKYRG